MKNLLIILLTLTLSGSTQVFAKTSFMTSETISILIEKNSDDDKKDGGKKKKKKSCCNKSEKACVKDKKECAGKEGATKEAPKTEDSNKVTE